MRIKLKTKIIAFVVVPLLITIVASTLVNVVSMIANGNVQLEKYQEELLDGVKERLKTLTEVAASSVENRYQMENSELSQKTALETVTNLKFGSNGYFYIQSEAGIMLAHKYAPQLVGTDVNGTVDPNGVKITVETLKIVKENGDGYIRYMWPKPGSKDPQPKIVYSKLFKPWGWILSTGVYIDDIEVAVAKEQKNIEANIREMVTKTVLLGLGLTVLVAIFTAILVSKGITKRIIELVNALKTMEEESDFSLRSEASGNDEISESKKAFNQLFESIRVSMNKIGEVLQSISQGDLSKDLELDSKGDMKKLLLSVNQSIQMLRQLIRDIKVASLQVSSGSDELARSSESLASGTSEQAASLEEISSSMNEVDAQTKINTENASSASQLSQEMLDKIQEGNQHMKQLTLSMSEINETSNNVTKIIKVIDEIAFQTNLLALNAAVEAARAGKYGKGFAVVAEEVRNLAGRSAEAARNTTELIEASFGKVEEGVNNTSNTASILEEISESANKVNDLVSEIAASSTEQKSGIEEINKGMVQINSVIQQNASISEEAASASKELSSLAMNLETMMKRFKLNDEETQFIEHEQYQYTEGLLEQNDSDF